MRSPVSPIRSYPGTEEFSKTGNKKTARRSKRRAIFLESEEVNFIMMNMHNNKKARIIMGVVIVILIVAMVAPMALSVMM